MQTSASIQPRTILLKFVGDSVIGKEVNLGAHVTLANLRLDKKEIDVMFKKTRYKTGKKKFGSVIGDYASIGCSVVLNPGTIVAKKVKIPPLITKKGYVD